MLPDWFGFQEYPESEWVVREKAGHQMKFQFLRAFVQDSALGSQCLTSLLFRHHPQSRKSPARLAQFNAESELTCSEETCVICSASMTKKYFYHLFAFLFLTAVSGAQTFTVCQNGSDPSTVPGIGNYSYGAGATTGTLASDSGLPAYVIKGLGQNSQFGWETGAFTNSELSGIANYGFDLTMVARVLPGVEPSWTLGSEVEMATCGIGFDATTQFIISLGLDASGNTHVMLPTAYDNSGPGSSVIMTSGSEFTLSGNGYHTYELKYDVSTQSATLFVDGIQELSGYQGDSDYSIDSNNFGASLF